ncbi:hypothetical protein LCGC14_1741440 [marine sediment metagenome]|uniref:Radical SAM core domain-containing protein n=1 Tax=marine sediment metagenome TaxID=412755 RepID=A0A0F9JLR3_9ZZZZ
MTVKNNTNNNLLLINYPPKYPKSVHLYITNECNLDCRKCFYRSSSDIKKELSFEVLKDWFYDWKKHGLTSIAIGGGEPLLHPSIIETVKLAKEMGFHVSVTSNGTQIKEIKPDRVHISYDTLHPTWKTKESEIQEAINYYSKLGCKIGINHIVSNLENIEYIEGTFKNVDNILLIREKPISSFTQWDSIPHRDNYWVEGCIEGSVCEQGILSFHVDYESNASICSNLKKTIKYTTLEETWNKLKKFNCDIRDSKAPRPF